MLARWQLNHQKVNSTPPQEIRITQHVFCGTKAVEMAKKLIGLNSNNNNRKLRSRKTYNLEAHECGVMYSSCMYLHLCICLLYSDILSGLMLLRNRT